MRRNSCLTIFGLGSLFICGCYVSGAVPQTAVASWRAKEESPSDKRIELKQFLDFDAEDSVSIAGYRAVKRRKSARTTDYPKPIDVTYAVVTQNGKLLSKFDGFAGQYHPMGNGTDFAMFSFLPNGPKQLLIEQTQWRNWKHWIVSFSPRYRVIFDGKKWGVNRELMYGDIDGDGVHEISQAVTAFVFFEDFTDATSHLVDIVFKYDPKAQEYLPTNQLLQAYSLAGIEDRTKARSINPTRKLASEVLFVVLRYIYAGKRNEAWSFYNREYNLPDKERLRGKILATLRHEPVYRFLYRETQPNKSLDASRGSVFRMKRL